MQFQETCYTVVPYAPYVLLQIYTITIIATCSVTIFDFFSPWAPAYISLKCFVTNFVLLSTNSLLCFTTMYQCMFDQNAPNGSEDNARRRSYVDTSADGIHTKTKYGCLRCGNIIFPTQYVNYCTHFIHY